VRIKRIAIVLIATLLGTLVGSDRGADPAVTVAEDNSSYTLDNEKITAKVSKRSGDLVSLRYKDLELLVGGSGHAFAYWSHAGPGAQNQSSVTIDPATHGGERGEVACKFLSLGKSVGQGPGGSVIADIEIRYALGRGDTAIYTYCMFDHKPNYPATSIGEARFGAKLNGKVFDWMTIDVNRNKQMPAPEDWDKGTQLNMKEARRLNTGIYAGQVEHKYDYSAIQFDIPAFGWSSTKNQIGLWFVNPTIEYLSGGATKVELTGHLDNNVGGAPTLLNYWRGSHYGGSRCEIAAGEAWKKVIGPFLIYCNSGATPNDMWKDALARAGKESAAWPYEWVSGVDYPHKNERASVAGEIVLNDPQAPDLKLSNLLVGLAWPDYPARGGRGFGGGSGLVDWQQDAKHYQFWVRADEQGHFTVPNVRPGEYTLHAIADGVLGEYALNKVSVQAGKTLELGRLEWKPKRFGRQLWEIGIPNRSAQEFRHGDHYWQWGLYNDYAKEFPDDVNFVIGKSDLRKDWNYCQCPRADRPNGTTWSVTFDLPQAPSGKATLRLALAANSARNIQVAVNDQAAGPTGPMPDTATIRRDGIRGLWLERDVAFDAGLMKGGNNVLKLTIPPGGVMSGVEYDYLRLELAESATP
jgi:rhamnogalacturonan endolyase